MPSKDSVIKTARMNKETWEEVEKLMNSEDLTFSGVIKWLVENRDGVHPQKSEETQRGTPQENALDMPQEQYEDLKKMCQVSGLSIGKFMDFIYRLFNDGKIYIDGLAVKTRGECNLDELLDICHRANADPQEMIDKIVASLVRR